ncbi:MAG: hypothetical protein ABR915_22155, partial [Thermoguttaceae bacterium]
MNLYEYCDNSPVNRTDPLGLQEVPIDPVGVLYDEAIKEAMAGAANKAATECKIPRDIGVDIQLNGGALEGSFDVQTPQTTSSALGFDTGPVDHALEAIEGSAAGQGQSHTFIGHIQYWPGSPNLTPRPMNWLFTLRVTVTGPSHNFSRIIFSKG